MCLLCARVMRNESMGGLHLHLGAIFYMSGNDGRVIKEEYFTQEKVSILQLKCDEEKILVKRKNIIYMMQWLTVAYQMEQRRSKLMLT